MGAAASSTPGAPPRSLYRKIRVVLAEARRGKAQSHEALRDRVREQGHLDFTRHRVGDDDVVETVPCSSKSVERVVEKCEELGLVNKDTARLTKLGTEAVAPGRFDAVVSSATKRYLSEKGAAVATISEAVSDLLQICAEDTLPTADRLWECLQPAIEKDDFRAYLGLLGATGGISYSRRKIYLPR